MAYKGLSAYGEPVGPDELADVQEELRRLQTENVRFKNFLKNHLFAEGPI